jgi:hypothetical protein
LWTPLPFGTAFLTTTYAAFIMIESESHHAHVSPAARRFVKWGIGVAIASAAIALVVGVGGFALGMLSIFSPNTANSTFASLFDGVFGNTKPETRTVPGNANAFDPIAAFEAVKTFAGSNVQLVSIEASQVRRDGTLDLTASYRPAPYVTYRFVRAVARPTNAPPVGAGGTRDGPWFETITIDAYEPGQHRRVKQTTASHRRTYTYVNEGMTRAIGEPSTGSDIERIVAAPRCSLVELWAIAIKSGAPQQAVARINYDAKGYRFSISGTKLNLAFDATCQRTR